MREIRKYTSSDGREFATQRECAEHECSTTVPAKLRQRLLKFYQEEHGAITSKIEQVTFDRMCATLLLNRRNARVIRDVLQEFSSAATHLPLEPVYN
ncbi:hypothetical protein GQ56_0101045 [Burkholderia paludis]|uniref:hypothetical protein n=1 Tax=Burkholderia paludis TaxID=1506587 RepID=UPI0004DB7FA6|nr:hypothetical protein [Burkholderia paludis]KFG99073.1 hypothetical protein GQ56_0101045 [Burkholderia paludis]